MLFSLHIYFPINHLIIKIYLLNQETGLDSDIDLDDDDDDEVEIDDDDEEEDDLRMPVRPKVAPMKGNTRHQPPEMEEEDTDDDF